MGTPSFAVESLRAIVENGFHVVGVVTAPDKPAGRGHKVQESAVKQYATGKGIPVLQPTKLKDEEFISQLKNWEAHLQVVVAFRMLPEVVWSMPPLGTFNLHASLLPQYRGAAPIQHAIIQGEKQSGVTTFFLTHEIDTGHIILQDKVDISFTDNAGTLHDKLMYKGASLVLRTINQIVDNTLQITPQNLLAPEEGSLHSAPKIYKETCQIPWEKSALEVYNFIRGLAPYPAAWSMLPLHPEGEPVYTKILSATLTDTQSSSAPGTLHTDGKSFIHVSCADQWIAIESLQVPGKRAMSTTEFLRGAKL